VVAPDGRQIAFSMLVPEEPPVLVTAPAKPKDAEWADAPRVTTRVMHERDGAGFIEPGYKHYFVISELGGTARQITSGDYQHRGTPQWSGDGKSLIFSANRNDDWELNFVNSEIYSVSLESGETVALTDRNGPDEEPRLSPDGEKIAYWSFEDKIQTYQVTQLHVMNVDGTDKRVLTADLDRSVSGIAWDRGSDGVYFQYNDHGDTRIGYTTLSGKSRVVASSVGGESVARPYSVQPGGSCCA